MSTLSRFPTWRVALPLAVMLVALPVSGPAQARGKTKINYVPGITLVPDVLLPDGQKPRLYPNTTPGSTSGTAAGTTFWHEGLPIQQGDKIKLNVFVATGGADLKEIKVRLDNTQIADLTASPWNALIDTAKMDTGTHMFEVWAQATGDPPQSSTKALSFFIVKQLVGGDVGEQQAGGQPTEGTPQPDPNTPAALPPFLIGKTVDDSATVTIGTRSADVPFTGPNSTPTTPAGDAVTVTGPTIFSVRTAPGSAATQYAYALVRDGNTILTSNLISLVSRTVYTDVKIEPRTETQAGLRSGQVVLWVWGVDADGRPGSPSKVELDIQ